MLNILVMGAGAIGCFVGGMLATSGHRVTLLGRPPLMNKISANGLQLLWPQFQPQTIFPQTAVSINQLAPPYDFILITVKTPDTAEIIKLLAAQPQLISDAHIVSLQNGIGSEEQLAAAFGPEKVIAGTVTIPIRVPEPGVIEISKTKGGLGLAPLQISPSVFILAAALNQAGLNTETYLDYRTMKWSKLLLNIVNNASCAILNQTPAQIIARPELYDLEIEALREAVTVMKALGITPIKLPGYPVSWLVRLVMSPWLPNAIFRAILRPFLLSGRGTKMPSLQIDLAAGRSTSEIMALNGAVVQAGQKLHVATPVNQALTNVLTSLISGDTAWTDYKNRPDQLLKAVAAVRDSQPVIQSKKKTQYSP
jgi:2-dehydropantoate 2-reductase